MPALSTTFTETQSLVSPQGPLMQFQQKTSLPEDICTTVVMGSPVFLSKAEPSSNGSPTKAASGRWRSGEQRGVHWPDDSLVIARVGVRENLWSQTVTPTRSVVIVPLSFTVHSQTDVPRQRSTTC